jgi:hypothetical protein
MRTIESAESDRHAKCIARLHQWVKARVEEDIDRIRRGRKSASNRAELRRQRKQHPRALAERALGADRAAMRLHDAA